MKTAARWLRKLADFIDPRINPSTDSSLTIHVTADTAQADEQIANTIREAERLLALSERLSGAIK